MGGIIDETTGLRRPYDPDLDFDKPLALFGDLLPDTSTVKAVPLNPLKDLK